MSNAKGNLHKARLAFEANATQANQYALERAENRYANWKVHHKQYKAANKTPGKTQRQVKAEKARAVATASRDRANLAKGRSDAVATLLETEGLMTDREEELSFALNKANAHLFRLQDQAAKDEKNAEAKEKEREAEIARIESRHQPEPMSVQPKAEATVTTLVIPAEVDEDDKQGGHVSTVEPAVKSEPGNHEETDDRGTEEGLGLKTEGGEEGGGSR
ncbi:MAG: hypothetical protein Q9208_004881 [Pyrenodesmia sp. 3 TL-2023]